MRWKVGNRTALPGGFTGTDLPELPSPPGASPLRGPREPANGWSGQVSAQPRTTRRSDGGCPAAPGAGRVREPAADNRVERRRVGAGGGGDGRALPQRGRAVPCQKSVALTT